MWRKALRSTFKHCFYSPKSNPCYNLGQYEFMHTAELFDIYDGPANHHGPVKTRCWTNGWENNPRNANVSSNKTHDGRVCVS